MLDQIVNHKRMNKTALVPCIVRPDGLAEEDSLSAYVQRVPLHPLGQFRAFQAMREKGRLCCCKCRGPSAPQSSPAFILPCS
ncbi:MAG: hypothetical protein RIB70_06895 [Roseitalea porphyridii]|uniref:hypothetical protein n=1 Tax=Roseitalea porphyridii TaxID=1852022 RepID=UPI0032EEDC17